MNYIHKYLIKRRKNKMISSQKTTIYDDMTYTMSNIDRLINKYERIIA